MKYPNILSRVLTLCVAFVLTGNAVTAQNSRENQKKEQTEKITTAIEHQDFTFRAQSILPLSGPRRELSSYYDMQVTADKVVSFLPYMGRIYMPPIDPSEGPLRFTSKDFVYMEKPGKKGGWNVSIQLKDVRTVQQCTLNISDDGYATLEVRGNDRQPVTFYGYIVGNG